MACSSFSAPRAQAIDGTFLFASVPPTAVMSLPPSRGLCSESGTERPVTILPYSNIVITFHFEKQGLCSEFRTLFPKAYPKLLCVCLFPTLTFNLSPAKLLTCDLHAG